MAVTVGRNAAGFFILMVWLAIAGGYATIRGDFMFIPHALLAMYRSLTA